MPETLRLFRPTFFSLHSSANRCKLSGNYGRLSELCHVSKGEFLAEFAESLVAEGAASPWPHYREEWAKELLSIHIAHMLALAIEVYLLQEELYPERKILDISNHFEKIAQILISTGFWEEVSTKEETESAVANHPVHVRSVSLKPQAHTLWGIGS